MPLHLWQFISFVWMESTRKLHNCRHSVIDDGNDVKTLLHLIKCPIGDMVYLKLIFNIICHSVSSVRPPQKIRTHSLISPISFQNNNSSRHNGGVYFCYWDQLLKVLTDSPASYWVSEGVQSSWAHTVHRRLCSERLSMFSSASPSFERSSYVFQVELSQISVSLVEVQLDYKYLKGVKHAKERYL